MGLTSSPAGASFGALGGVPGDNAALAAALAAAGKVRQVVVHSLAATVTGSTADAWAAVTAATITPIASDSKILVFVAGSVNLSIIGTLPTIGAAFRIVNGGTPLSQADDTGGITARGSTSVSFRSTAASGSSPVIFTGGFMLLESHEPGSIAAQTYTLQIFPARTPVGAFSWTVNANSFATMRGTTKMILIEIAP